MDNTITAVINGEERPLNYSMEVMFKVNEKFGGVKQVMSVIEEETRESIKLVAWLAVEMANDGELCRRAAGYDHRGMLTVEDIDLMRMKPLDYVELKDAVVDAIVAGYHREVDGDDEVDLGLAELNEKKAQAGE